MSPAYCGECGWNLNEVSGSFRKQDRIDRIFVWVVFGLGALIAIPTLLHGISWRGGPVVLVALGTLGAVCHFGRTRTRIRTDNLLNAVAKKPDVDLSSATLETMPAKIITYVESLRSLPRPRQTRLNLITRAVIWLARLLPAFLGYFALRSLIFPGLRVYKFYGPTLYLLEALLAIGLWFLIPIQLKKDSRLDLLIDGEIAMGRITPVSRWQLGTKVAFEFHDTIGNLVRAQGANHTGCLLEGTCVPVFYDAQNPTNCVPACALNHELVLPEGMAAIHLPSRA